MLSTFLNDDGIHITDPFTIGTLFNSYFSTVFQTETIDNFKTINIGSPTAEFLTETLVTQCLNTNRSLNAIGPDGVPLRFWKNLASVL